jgi:filamentous hemagglutinin family protein
MHYSRKRPFLVNRLRSFAHLAKILMSVGLFSCLAQVALDGKFGTSGSLPGPNYSITPEMGLTRGKNLFHSFSQFDLKAGDVASFSGPAGIQNILSRVTGASPSSIDGSIRSQVPGANFFLINPSGVVLGPNAVVDVSGSFAASSANYLKLADGARFVASLDADDSLLSSEPVAAFGFLDGASGSVEVRGAVTSGQGASLSLVGSAVSVADGALLDAGNGQINLVGGVVAAGEIRHVSSLSTGPGLVFTSPPGEREAGSVVIRGGRLVLENALVSTVDGGDIVIRASDGVQVGNGGQIIASSSGAFRGGDITIDSPAIMVDGKDGPLPTRIAAETFSADPEAGGGNIVIHSGSLELRQGAEISVSSFGAADAGRLDIRTSRLRVEGSDAPQYPTQISANASPTIGGLGGDGGQIVIHADSVEIGNGAGVLAATTGDANAGTIEIHSGSLTLHNGAVTTFTAGAGEGGEILVESDDLTMDGPFSSITALTTGLNDQAAAGKGGLIHLKTGRLQLLNDAAISANTFGDAQGGNINITAGSLLLDTATFQPGSIPGITASSNPSFFGEGGGGGGGDISITADTLILRHGMVISTTTLTPGDGGSINISAGSVELESGSSIQSASQATGHAGTLSIGSNMDIQLTGQSSVSTSALQSQGGDIHLRAGHEVRLFDSQVTAQAGPGGGGNIHLAAPILTYLLDSTLTAQAQGDGGNLAVETRSFVVNRSSLISKSSTANGGNITLQSEYFLQSDTIIDASAPFGLPGTVKVTAPDVDLSGSLIGLPGNLLDAESQLRPDCSVRLTGNASSFVILGRGGLPPEPGGFVPSVSVFSRDEEP